MMDSGRRTFLKQSFGTLGSLLFGPSAEPTTILTKPALPSILSEQEELSWSVTLGQFFNARLDRFNKDDLSKEIDSFKGNRIRLAKLSDEIERSFFVSDCKREGIKTNLRTLLQTARNGKGTTEYKRLIDSYGEFGISKTTLPKFEELPDLIREEAAKPDDYYANKCREVLEVLKEEVLKDKEMSKPTFADMAAARKAIQYPVYAPEQSYDETEIAVRIAKKAYTRNTNFCELIADKNSSCEAKAR